MTEVAVQRGWPAGPSGPGKEFGIDSAVGRTEEFKHGSDEF